jgi:hypothetical protein
MSPREGARYRAIEAVNGTTNVEYLAALERQEDGTLVGETTDGRRVLYAAGYPVKIKAVRCTAAEVRRWE